MSDTIVKYYESWENYIFLRVHYCTPISHNTSASQFLDPIGSLVSTLLVSGLLVVTLFQIVRLEEWEIGRVWDWKSVGLGECRIGRV